MRFDVKPAARRLVVVGGRWSGVYGWGDFLCDEAGALYARGVAFVCAGGECVPLFRGVVVFGTARGVVSGSCMNQTFHEEVVLYIESADEAIKVAQLNLENGFYAAAINRAYYAIFYAANAVLATQNLARSKHSGVLAAFRQQFIKTGVLPTELSVIYGQVMEDRQEGDYEIMTASSKDDADYDLHQARFFVEQVKLWLRIENWL